jgi:hypothetical protein
MSVSCSVRDRAERVFLGKDSQAASWNRNESGTINGPQIEFISGRSKARCFSGRESARKNGRCAGNFFAEFCEFHILHNQDFGFSDAQSKHVLPWEHTYGP